MLSKLNKPEYFYRPSLFFRRFNSPGSVVALPWGASLRVNPAEDIGRAVALKGVYDLPVTEALMRLTDKGDVAFDIGANVGYMSAVFAARGATVYAFEPHPAIFPVLEENARRLSVTALRLALSDRDGTARLSEPEGFAHNEGIARISEEGQDEIKCSRLDSLDLPAPSIIKLDVEGHELAVLRGAGSLIGQVRDIVFEEHDDYPTPATDYLERAGYQLFGLGVRLTRPTLTAPSERSGRDWEARSLLATLDVQRAKERFKPRGWSCLAY